MENTAQKTNRWSAVGRVLFAGYLGALLFGPPYGDAHSSWVVLGMIFGLSVPGLIAGSRRGFYAGALWGVFVFMTWLFPVFVGVDTLKDIELTDAIRCIEVFLIVIMVGTVAGFIGGFISKWIRLDAWLSRYKSWSTVGLVTASLLLYTWTIGGIMAARTIDSSTTNFDGRSSIRVHAWGVYPVGVFTCGDALEDIAITDPTGLIILGTFYEH